MKRTLLLTYLLMILFLTTSITQAATINVPSEQPTIQAGINASVDGDIVLIADGTYTGSGNYNIDFNGKSITIKSSGGADVCIIDCQQNGRGFLAYLGETVTLDGLTIENADAGDDNNGGAVYANESDIIITDCIFESNRSSNGGAVYSSSSSMFTNCTFTDNSVSAYQGGAVYCSTYSSSSVFTSCTFTGNNSHYGGAVCADGSSIFTECTFTNNSVSGGYGAVKSGSSSIFTRCIFSGNSASDGPGAVWSCSSSIFTECSFINNNAFNGPGAVQGSSITFTDCTFSDNSASGYTYNVNNTTSGVAGALRAGNCTLINCIFTGNSTSDSNSVYGWGGAVLDWNSTFTNCTFSKNSAFYGGAVYCPSSSSFNNCTFTSNEATEQGGTIWCDIPLAPEDPITLKNCILWGNTAPEGSEIYENEKPLIITYSDVQGGHTGEGNIDTDPLFVDSVNDDLHLQYGSPCIDSGTADGAPADDLDGYLRPVGDGYDMGAYEYHYDSLLWQGYSNSWNDSNNWQPNMVPVEFNAVVISELPDGRGWPTVDNLNSEAKSVLIESGTLTIELGQLSIGGS